mgnify:CR=1 FL=1
MINTALKSIIFFTLFFALLIAISGCGIKPLRLVPQFGSAYGADEIECTYTRKAGKFVTVCILHDEGEVE